MKYTVKCCNVPCGAPVSVGFNPEDFAYRTFCANCHEKMYTHRLTPFCTHGYNLLALIRQDNACDCTFESASPITWDWLPMWRTDTKGMTLKEIGKVYGDEVCKNCGEPAKNYVGCVLGPPPGTCGACETLTDEQRVELAKSRGIPIGEPEME